MREELMRIGVDYNTALDRCMGMEDLYREFLQSFLHENPLPKLEKYIVERNVKDAFKAAHTLKGLCGNLGFSNILEFLSPLVEILRDESLDGADELLLKVKERYQELEKVLLQI